MGKIKFKDFKKYGIDESYLSEILGKEVRSCKVEEVRKGARLRADLYRFRVHFEDKEELAVFVKDVWYSPNISGDIVKPLNENRQTLGENELRFLQFGTEKGAFPPRYFGHRRYNSESGEHIIMIKGDYDMSLEEKLYELDMQMNEADEEEKNRLEELKLNYVKRAIDIALVNNHIATTQGYPTKDSVGSPTIYTLDEDMLARDLKVYLKSLLTFKFKDPDAVVNWMYEHPNFANSLVGLIKPLVEDVEKEGLVNLDLHPGNVLLKDIELPDYDDSDAIVGLRDGRKEASVYDAFAITDNNKIGRGSDAMIASLINHVSVNLSKEKLRELVDHVQVQREKLRQGKVVHLEDIDPNERRNFEVKYAAAGRLVIRNGHFVASLHTNHPEKAKELEEQLPFYNPKSFICRTIDRFISLDDRLTEYSDKVNRGLEALKPTNEPKSRSVA